jgi:predicted dehydrogenase
MVESKSVRVLFLGGEEGQDWDSLKDYLEATRTLRVEFRRTSRTPEDFSPYGVILLAEPGRLSDKEQENLSSYVKQGGSCLGFVLPSGSPLPPLFGVQVGPASPLLELRVRMAHPDHPMARRLPPEFFLKSRFQSLEPRDGDSEPILNTDWQYRRVPVAVCRKIGAGRIGSITLTPLRDDFFHQLIHRFILHLAGLPEPSPQGVAILGYGPLGSMGSLHALAVQELPGLDLLAFCDYSRDRLLKCREDFPQCRAYSSAKDLGKDPEVNLVIIATPPNTHASLATQLLRVGKHVVCEKPLCLTAEEAEQMIQAAAESGQVLSCYQNRRWDVDFLGIRQALQEGLVGDPFYLETFVGDFQHPCSYWHSHRPISGDALFDWGAHHVDWILNLFPGPTARVMGTLQKRVWSDVTNADQVRAQIFFADGKEAEFLYSDVAALRKPKWYILGTEGAITGDWWDSSVLERDPISYYREYQIPVTETTPSLVLRRRHSSGSMAVQQLALPPAPRRFPFHSNLADHLLTGEPLAVTARSAARVVAVLQAATRSAQGGGNPEALCV